MALEGQVYAKLDEICEKYLKDAAEAAKVKNASEGRLKRLAGIEEMFIDGAVFNQEEQSVTLDLKTQDLVTQFEVSADQIQTNLRTLATVTGYLHYLADYKPKKTRAVIHPPRAASL